MVVRMAGGTSRSSVTSYEKLTHTFAKSFPFFFFYKKKKFKELSYDIAVLQNTKRISFNCMCTVLYVYRILCVYCWLADVKLFVIAHKCLNAHKTSSAQHVPELWQTMFESFFQVSYFLRPHLAFLFYS